VQVVAVGAATRDPRFAPLTLAELDKVRIEIAILSPLRPIKDLQQVIVGQDGLLIEGLGRRGLLLPKVAVRMGWDRESFLEGVCSKAGLPPDCWPGACSLYAFTSLVFDEANMNTV
jgi:AmmeMemoRadiSam system protein A